MKKSRPTGYLDLQKKMKKGAQMALQEEFEKAAAEATQLPERPSNEVLLELYGLYKQGMEGDVSGEAPGMMEFVARAKYNAWQQLKGMSRQEAQQKYVDRVNTLKGA